MSHPGSCGLGGVVLDHSELACKNYFKKLPAGVEED
jgi:hypothetical protein